jgi:hypothetical protein
MMDVSSLIFVFGVCCEILVQGAVVKAEPTHKKYTLTHTHTHTHTHSPRVYVNNVRYTERVLIVGLPAAEQKTLLLHSDWRCFVFCTAQSHFKENSANT